jgi:hypothetical protein
VLKALKRYENTFRNMRFFNHYTQGGCQFECAINRGVEICGCANWNFPQDPIGVCDRERSICFEQVIAKRRNFFAQVCLGPNDYSNIGNDRNVKMTAILLIVMFGHE